MVCAWPRDELFGASEALLGDCAAVFRAAAARASADADRSRQSAGVALSLMGASIRCTPLLLLLLLLCPAFVRRNYPATDNFCYDQVSVMLERLVGNCDRSLGADWRGRSAAARRGAVHSSGSGAAGRLQPDCLPSPCGTFSHFFAASFFSPSYGDDDGGIAVDRSCRPWAPSIACFRRAAEERCERRKRIVVVGCGRDVV